MPGSKDYWLDRETNQLKLYQLQEEEYTKELNGIYDYMMDLIQKEIDGFYSRYAKSTGMTIADARKACSKLDIEEYGRKAKQYVKNRTFTKEANAEMKLYNLTMKVNRLEMLKARIGLELVSGFDEMQKYFDEKLTERTLDEFDRQAGILGETVKEPEKKAKAIVNASFKNARFSDRVWMYQDLMKAELSKLLQEGLIQGQSPLQLATHLRKLFGVQKSSAERLMRTELARVQIEAQKQSFIENEFDEYMFISTEGRACDQCGHLHGKVFKVAMMMPGTNAPPMHPNCRCSTAAYVYREAEEISREIPELDAEVEVKGINDLKNGYSLKGTGKNQFGDEEHVITLQKRLTTAWDDLSPEERLRRKWSPEDGKPFNLAKGDYKVQKLLGDGRIERDTIAKQINGSYVGTVIKTGGKVSPVYIDLYNVGGSLKYSVGKADVKTLYTEKAVNTARSVVLERERIVLDNLMREGVSVDPIARREGDSWVAGMKGFHKAVNADGLPKIVSYDEYKANNNPVLYRGIAPASRLRKDITTTMSTKEMAKQFFESSDLFPSRGVYGDGVAYASPEKNGIARAYATNNGATKHGGVIVEFKLQKDAKTILYEDALDLFQKMTDKGSSTLVLNRNQAKAYNTEVGKAMNILGYDAIIKHNGDNTGFDFYVVLNRGALESTKRYINEEL